MMTGLSQAVLKYESVSVCFGLSLACPSKVHILKLRHQLVILLEGSSAVRSWGLGSKE